MARVELLFTIPARTADVADFTKSLRRFADGIDAAELAGKYLNAPLTFHGAEIYIGGIDAPDHSTTINIRTADDRQITE